MWNSTRSVARPGTACAFVVLGIILAGCATSSSERIDVRGNYPDVGRGNAEGDENPGRLVVYTPVFTDTYAGRADFWWYERPHVVHSGYTIYDSEGKRVRQVRNHSLWPSTSERPAEVALAPGRYLIQADMAGQHPDRFWVTVEAQKETRVDVSRIGAPATPEIR